MSHPDRPILLQAFGIHAGGGRVLLDELILSAAPLIRAAALDSRYVASSPLVPDLRARSVEIIPVAPRISERLRALRTLAQKGGEGDVLLHFNSLPPLTRTAARSITFLHAAYLLGPGGVIRYPLKARSRHFFERCLLRLGNRNVDEYWVQSESIALALGRKFPAARIRIAPFVDSAIVHPPQGPADGRAPGRFFYPSDAMAHKSHINLLKAWEILNRQQHVELVLTLDQHVYQGLADAAGISPEVRKAVVNLGPLPRAAVLEEMSRATALIFPSISETFGLPLLEATATGTPIVASEMDYVRDVCVPAQTFDPHSPRSIARAVQRFLGSAAHPPPPLSGAEFVKLLQP